MIAATAQNGARVEFVFRPNPRRVAGKFRMAGVTREPLAAALEPDRYDVAFAVIMSAPRFGIHVQTSDQNVADDRSLVRRLHRDAIALHSLDRATEAPPTFGHSSTSTDPITQHTLMKTNPTSNDPVR